jgi:hypothetical protein
MNGSGIDVAQLVANNESLRVENVEFKLQNSFLVEKVAFLEQEVLRLRAMLDKNSGIAKPLEKGAAP